MIECPITDFIYSAPRARLLTEVIHSIYATSIYARAFLYALNTREEAFKEWKPLKLQSANSAEKQVKI
jgi:hypothetical protein